MHFYTLDHVNVPISISAFSILCLIELLIKMVSHGRILSYYIFSSQLVGPSVEPASMYIPPPGPTPQEWNDTITEQAPPDNEIHQHDEGACGGRNDLYIPRSVRTQYGMAESGATDETERKQIQTTAPFYNSAQQRGRPEREMGINYCESIGRNTRQRMRSRIRFQSPMGPEDSEVGPHVLPVQNDWTNALEPAYENSASEVEYYEDYNSVTRNNIAAPYEIRSIEEVIELRDIHTDGDDEKKEDADNEDHLKLRMERNTEEEAQNHGRKEHSIQKLIIADLVLKELKSQSNTFVHTRPDLDFTNAPSVARGLPVFPELKSIVLHCGFKHHKKVIDESLKEQVKRAINDLDEMFPEASIFISAALPCRGNKNRVKIDLVNAAIECACDETSAQFVDLTAALVDAKSSKIDPTLYNDTASLNSKGVKKIEKMITQVIDSNLDVAEIAEVQNSTKKVFTIGKDKITMYPSKTRDRQINLTFMLG